MFLRNLIALICAATLLGSVAVVPGSAEEGCTPSKSRRLFRQFVVAYNKGDIKRLNFIFPPEQDFAMYRVFPERTEPNSGRSGLMDYFRDRHSKGDHLKLRKFTAGSERSPDGSCGISFTLERTSGDVLPWANATFLGKGGVKPENSRYMWAVNMSWSP